MISGMGIGFSERGALDDYVQLQARQARARLRVAGGVHLILTNTKYLLGGGGAQRSGSVIVVSESDQADTSLDVSSLALCEPGPYYRERAFLPREFSQVTTEVTETL